MILTVWVVTPPVASVVVTSNKVVPDTSIVASDTVISPVVPLREVPAGRLPEANTAEVMEPSVSLTEAN